MMRARAAVCLCLLGAELATGGVIAGAGPGRATADLMDRYQSGQQRSHALHARIRAENDRISGYEGSARSLRQRLTAIKRSVVVQERLLSSVTEQLTGARRRLVALRATYARDRSALAAQLRAQYEAPPPTVMNVVVDAQGFDDLVSGLRNLTAVRRRNVATVRQVAAARVQVSAQTVRLARVQARRRRSTTTVVDERDQIAQLRASIVERELRTKRSRRADSAALAKLHTALVHEAKVLDARAARAQAQSGGVGGTPVVAPGGCTNRPFVAHGGPYGFFPAPGTNYSVNQEPVLAARLDQLGRALQLHLIGISGYRSPAHSVEVGGFADDPHTKGIASDTPGVEGVPEATLERFCLTRPFPGAREADHIQEN